MRSSQWFLIGIFFTIMMLWFISVDKSFSQFCDFSDNSRPISKADIAVCVKGEVYGPFIMLLFPLSFVFYICGVIELIAEYRSKK